MLSAEKDLVLMLITFFACLFLPLEYGVLIGIVANVGFIMCSAAKPKISIQVQKVRYLSSTLILIIRCQLVIFIFFKEPRRDQIPVVDTRQIFDIPFDGIRTANDNQTRPCSWDPSGHRWFQCIRGRFHNGKRTYTTYHVVIDGSKGYARDAAFM
jgi:MFS superfamily sulfate permease-like transporter